TLARPSKRRSPLRFGDRSLPPDTARRLRWGWRMKSRITVLMTISMCTLACEAVDISEEGIAEQSSALCADTADVWIGWNTAASFGILSSEIYGSSQCPNRYVLDVSNLAAHAVPELSVEYAGLPIPQQSCAFALAGARIYGYRPLRSGDGSWELI